MRRLALLLAAMLPSCLAGSVRAQPVRFEVEVGVEAMAAGDQAIWALATASDASGRTLTLAAAAQRLHADHFNWLQYITRDPDIAACRAKPWLQAMTEDCPRLLDAEGRLPTLPALDPPLGGWRYEGRRFPTADYRPFYWDEYFAASGAPSPERPEVVEYQTRLDHLPQRPGEYAAASGAPLDEARGLFFNDRPVNEHDGRSVFVTALVTVRGAGCRRIEPEAPCFYSLVDGTAFAWRFGASGRIAWEPISVPAFRALTAQRRSP